MDKEPIERMAKEAGICNTLKYAGATILFPNVTPETLAKFAARVADEIAKDYDPKTVRYDYVAYKPGMPAESVNDIAAAIRAKFPLPSEEKP